MLPLHYLEKAAAAVAKGLCNWQWRVVLLLLDVRTTGYDCATVGGQKGATVAPVAPGALVHLERGHHELVQELDCNCCQHDNWRQARCRQVSHTPTHGRKRASTQPVDCDARGVGGCALPRAGHGRGGGAGWHAPVKPTPNTAPSTLGLLMTNPETPMSLDQLQKQSERSVSATEVPAPWSNTVTANQGRTKALSTAGRRHRSKQGRRSTCYSRRLRSVPWIRHRGSTTC